MSQETTPVIAEGGEDRVEAPAARPPRGSTSLGRYQPGLDGIRAAGVLAILAYHGGFTYAKGGFLGVSQFFTLSGFLITGLLLRNHLRSSGRLSSFWARRVRRLLPAATVALVMVVIFGATIASPLQARHLPGDVAAAAAWVVNWKFILDDRSYAGLFAQPSPVQHFWSLAIEEQFYLLFPLLLLVIRRWTRSRRTMTAILAGAALLSTAWMAVLYERGADLNRLYYGTDTRMSELLVGAALAVLIYRNGFDFAPRTRTYLLYLGVACFAATLWCWAAIPLADGAIWKGGFLAYSLLTCGLILGVLAGRGPVVALLSLPPLVYIGRISYGVYLYHWMVFLWLTEDRTGLGQWPLFGLRLAVTFALSIASYHLLERRVVRGESFGLAPRARLVAIPVTLAVVVAAAFVVVDRNQADPLVALGQTPEAAPAVADDGVLDILVIPKSTDDPVAARLQQAAAADPKLSVRVTEPFECKGGLVEIPAGKTCASWAHSWPKVVEEYDPDTVLLLGDDWAGDSLEHLTKLPKAQLADGAKAILAPALDLLTAKGATIVRSEVAPNLTAAIQRLGLPYVQAMDDLETTRSDLYSVLGTELPDPATVTPQAFADAVAKAALTDAALYRRQGDADLPRILVVGDSQAETLGYGLERWGADGKKALVWNRASEGCGVVVDGEINTFGSSASGAERCLQAAKQWKDDVAKFHPDAVVVLSSLGDVQDRKLPGDDEFSDITDPAMEKFVLTQYQDAVDALSDDGAKVIWMTAPCTELANQPGQSDAYDSAHLDLLNDDVIPALVKSRSKDVTTFDLASVMCPGGKPLVSVDAVDEMRPDGVHFSADGARWFADKYGERLLTLADR